ncbi:MAG: hypothetical protein ACKOWF_05090 [Chloroflexota bacterium]
MTDSANAPQPLTPAMRLRARVAMVIVGLLVVTVAVLLPVVLFSLGWSLQEVQDNPVYNLITGELEANLEALEGDDVAYGNITIQAIDESTRAVTLLIAGNRVCTTFCPAISFGLYSLDNDGAMRRGLPPSATVEFAAGAEGTGPFSKTITLPVAGNPQRYPFDSYTLLLGLSASATRPDGRVFSVPPDMFTRGAALTVQNTMVRLKMTSLELVDPQTVMPKGTNETLLAAERIVFTRPIYLQILCSLLVLLISASGFFALATQTLRQLSIGIGGLILGIWGVRSIVIQGNLPEVTVVDSMLAIIILILLLGVAVRVALAVRAQTGWE